MKTPSPTAARFEAAPRHLSTPVRLHALLLAAVCILLLGRAFDARAANGTWTNDASGLWSATLNWLGGTIADGTDGIADFSTVNITANRTVTLDSSRNVGSLLFGNPATPALTNWTLNSSGGSILTLAVSSGSPTITTTNIANFNLTLAGTSGLTKAGSGTLVLGVTNAYTGPTTISAGTLQLTNALPPALSGPVLYLSFDNVSGKTVLNDGSARALLNGVIVGTNASITSGGRVGNALSVGPEAVNTGGLFINNGGPLLNNNAAGTWTVAMWIKTTTAGGEMLYQGGSSWASGNTRFYLAGNANDSVGSFFGGVRFAQGWEVGQTVVNDGNWHFVAMTTAAGNVKTIYVDGNVDTFSATAGDNSWNNTAVGSQLWIGGAPNISDNNVGFNGLIDEVYIYNRALPQSELQSIMTNSITPAGQFLPASTAVSITAPAKLDLNGNSVDISSLSGSGIVDTTLSGGTPTLTINNSADTVFSGAITNSTGTLTLFKAGAGNLTLAGTNGYTGQSVVGNGTLTLSGTNNLYNTVMTINAGKLVLSGTNNSTGTHSLNGGTLVVSNGVINSTGGTGTRMLVGNYAGAQAAVYQSGVNSLVNISSGGGGNFQLGSVPGASGYYNLSGGNIVIGNGSELDPAGSGGGAGTFGEFDMSGGTLTVGTSGTGATYFLPGRGGAGESSVVNILGGTVSINPAMVDGTFGGYEVNWAASGAAQTNTTTISGSAAFLSPSESVKLNRGPNAANVCSLNLNGGTFQTLGLNSTYTVSAAVNFNGGTLMAGSAANANFMTGLGGAYVYGGGATINDNGQSITIAQQLLAPAGSGITSISIATGGAGYVMPPQVIISDASGTGATAFAVVSGGAVTGITVTSPGNNYSAPTVTLVGGGYMVPATINTVAIAANVSGGLTKTGGGTLTLSGGYTYTGPTVVTGGTLSLNTGITFPGTPGDVIVSNATLTVNAAGGTALPANNFTLNSNAVLNLTPTPTANGVNAAGALTLAANVSLNLAYGTVSGNPTVAAINVGGTVSLPGGGNVINITAFGLQIGQFPLIKYSGAPLAGIANLSLGTLPPGVVATLVNNTGNDSIDLKVTGTGQNLEWYGLDPNTGLINPNWGINAPTNWLLFGTATSARYQEYTSGSSTVGDPVTFDDNIYNNGINPPATNINLTASLRPFQFTVNSSLPYSFTGSGSIVGLGGIVMTNTGSLTLGTSNSYTGGTFLDGGTVVVSNSFGLGAASGPLTFGGGTLLVDAGITNTGGVSVTANSMIDVATNLILRLGGPVSGVGGLTKIDNGTLVLAGTNSMSGPLTVSQGTLSIASSNNLPGTVTVGDTPGVNAIMTIAGNFNAANNASQFASGLLAGSAAGASGDIRLTSGSLAVKQQLGLGAGVGGYAALTISGGTVSNGSFIVVGFNNDQAVLNMSSGSLAISNNLMTIAAGGSASIGVVNLTGGTFNSTATTGNGSTIGGAFVGEFGNGTLNVSGSAAVNLTGWGLRLGHNSGANGIANLNGGTVTTASASQGGGVGALNFNGGTIKANAANAAFITGLASATIYAGGAIIDDGGFGITVPQALQSPTGYGVGAITLSSGGSGYIDTPIITIFGGSGSNATATATVSGGAVTAINITCAGTGYSSSDTLSVNISGGGGNGAAANTPVLAANIAGGLTKNGSGTLTLTGTNVLTGPLTNNAGTLSLSGPGTYSGSARVNGGSLLINTASQLAGNVTVTNGGTFGVTQAGTGTSVIGNLTLGLAGATNGATLSLVFAGGNSAAPLLTCGTLTLNGTNTVGIAGRFTVGAFPIVKYTGAIAGSGVFNTALAAPQGVVATLSNAVASSTLYAVITSTGPGLVWMGTNSNPALTNVWDIGSTTNWVIGSTPTTYQETVPPGDSVTFNDVGEGVVTVSNTVSPFSMVISNNAVSYTFQGPGHVAGPAGITKLGAGTVTINLTNDSYLGDTVISNGTAVMGSASALPGSSRLNVGPSGFLELNGNSENIGGLIGSGIIDDNSANSPTLTVGGGGAWNGTITNTLSSSGLFLTKNGNNILTIGGSNYFNAGGGGNGGVQVNGGTMVITNNGLVSVGNAEFWIAQGANTGTTIVDGGTLNVANNWLVIGRANAAGNGTLIVNHGTVQKAGANNIVLGSIGATGTLIVNGGQVLNNGMLWLGENSTANGYLYLNGGLVQATQVRFNINNGGAGPLNSIAYFNGGTLQATASSSNYIQVTSMVMSNGLVLDDNGFTLSIGQAALQDGDGFNGGLVKTGSGAVYLDVGNTYTGTTVVTNGLLAGSGSVAGPVVVGPSGNIGAGDAGPIVGTFSVGGDLTLHGTATMRINKDTPASDEITSIGTVHYGGTLVINNISSSPLTTNDTFQLFSANATTGNFASIAGSPGAGLAYSFSSASGVLSIVASGIAGNPTNITFTVSGNILSLSWPADHLGWILQSQTNSLTVGLSTNWVDVAGSASLTSTNLTMNPNGVAFFRLRHP